MTREQFNARFAANTENTSGYSDAEIAAINDAVFAAVADLDVDADDVHQHVKAAFDRAHAAR